MKKLFTSLILLMVGVMAAQATVKVGGTIPNASTGAFPFSGSGTAVLSGKTLTLTNAVINAGSNPGIESDVDGLTIVIKGNCKITGTNRGLYLKNNTTLTTSTASTLTIDNSSQSTYGAIKVENGATLLAEWLHLNITAQQFGISGLGNETLKLQCCEVNIELTSPGSSHSCIYGFSSLSTNANYWANGESYNTSKKELYKGSTYATSCSLKPEMTIANFIVNTHNSYTFNGGSDAGVTTGSITYNNSSKTLTLDGVTYSGSYRFIDNYKVDGLKIVVKGTNKIDNGNSYSIFSAVPFSIEGSSSTYTANKLSITKSYGALCLWLAGRSLTSGTLTLKNLTLDISGSTVPLYCATESGQSGSLVVEKCKISSKLTSSSTTHSSITKFSSVQLTNCCVNTASTPVYYNSSKKQFTNTSGALAQKVEIDVPTTNYDIDVCGMTLNNLNYSNVIVDGLTAGKISWNNSNKTLTMDGVKLASTNPNQAVVRPKVAGITVTVKNGVELSGGHSTFYPVGDFTISGSGELTCDATKCTNFGALYQGGSNSTITINVDGKAQFINGKYGYYGYNSTNTLVLKKAGNNSDYYFGGTSAAIYALKTLDLSHSTADLAMDFYSDDSYTGGGYPGCYFDEEAHAAKVNGGSLAKNVNFWRVTAWYDILVANVKINNCNRAGVGSKYITAGGSKAVTYNSDSGTLSLNNATINTGNANCALKYTGLSSNVTIDVTGNCEFKQPSGWVTTYLGGNTTIKGSGTLTVNGELGSYEGKSMTFDNVNIKAGKIISSSTKPSKLYVSLTTKGKTVSATDGIFNWGTIYLQNGTKVVKPDGAKLSDDYTSVVTSSGARATNVVLGDKTVTGIDGIEADANAEVIGIFDAQGRQLNEMQPGLNIIRMSDGTSKKVMVK